MGEGRLKALARAAAFGAAPDRIPRGVRDPEERWLVAVALGGQGHYAAAAAELALLAADPGVPRRLAAHAAVTRAAHLRQLGGHAAARRYDALGLRLATAALRGGPAVGAAPGLRWALPPGLRWAPPAGLRWAPPPGPRWQPASEECHIAATQSEECHIAATGWVRPGRRTASAGRRAMVSAMGSTPRGSTRSSGSPPTRWATRRRLSGCSRSRRPRSRPNPSWRPVTRAGWVRAELALLSGTAAAAVAPAEAALAAARHGGSLRHLLKSRIVLAVALGAAGVVSASDAVAELDAAAGDCARAGLLPLCWPASLAALDLAAHPQVRINEQVASSEGTAPDGRSDGTTRRRHAVHAALSVIEQRSDAVGKRQMGESVWIPRPATLM